MTDRGNVTKRILTALVGFSWCWGADAHPVVETDFRLGPAHDWVYSGTCSHEEGIGALLVRGTDGEVGTLSYRQPFETSRLKVSFSFCLEAGPHGLGDGLALGLIGTVSPEVVGDGEGLLGLGNIPNASASVIVEFDAVANACDDFGPLGAGLFHVGVAYSASGSVTGATHLPTLAAADLTPYAAGRHLVCLRVEVHLNGNRVTVCCGADDGEVVPLIQEELPDFLPFRGYLIFGAANGSAAGRAAVLSAAVETDMPAPPELSAEAVRDNEVRLTWGTTTEPYERFLLLRDGDEVAFLPGTETTFFDTVPGPGAYRYELRAQAEDDAWAPPVVISVFTGKPVLVADTHTSGAAPSPACREWLDRLEASERTACRATGFDGVPLERFGAVLILNGRHRPLSVGEELRLARYIAEAEAPRLYLEGADLWSFPQSGVFARADAVRGLEDGWPATSVTDRDGTAVAYHGASISLDTLAPAPEEFDLRDPPEYTVLWSRSLPPRAEDDTDYLALSARTPGNRVVLIASSVELYRIATPEARERAFGDYLELLETPPDTSDFRRGDPSGDGVVNIADAIKLLGHLFAGDPVPPCPDAADANDDGSIQISDAITLLAHLFAGGSVPAPGTLACGRDPTADALGPCRYDACR